MSGRGRRRAIQRREVLAASGMKKLAEILTGPDTWTQGTLHNGHGRRCLIGALIAAVGAPGHSKFLLEEQRLRRAIAREYGPLPKTPGLSPIATWNDTAGRTWEEVARVVEAYDRERLLNP